MSSPSPSPLVFGIPRLDELLGYQTDEKLTNDANDALSLRLFSSLSVCTSLTIVGEDGTGKSVFGLHLAAAYAALHYRYVTHRAAKTKLQRPLIVYASSDLRGGAAASVWGNFYLDFPWLRYIPSISESERQFRAGELDSVHELQNLDSYPGKNHLRVLAPDQVAAHALMNHPSKQGYEVLFIDLAAESTGDDWHYVSSLLAALRRREQQPPHLLVLDSVAGFETLVGRTNSFGEESSRRSRVSQLLRAAGDSWHVALIAEEPDRVKHHPEEYVTDTVIHLRRSGTQEQARRYLEIEKSRARTFSQGEHPFEIRDGRGTSTRSWENPDDPNARLHPVFRQKFATSDPERPCYNAYIEIFPSLHTLSKQFGGHHRLTSARSGGSDEETGPRKKFGIEYLDNMFTPGFPDSSVPPHAANKERKGLRGGTITALIGEEGTRKVSLAEEFLINAYADLPATIGVFLKLSDLYLRQTQEPDPDYFKFVKAHADTVIASAVLCPESKERLRWALQHFGDHLGTEKLNIGGLAHGGFGLKEPDDADLPLRNRWPTQDYLCKHDETEENEEEGLLVLAISAMRLPAGALAPTVFLATHDSSSEEIAARVIEQRWQDILAATKEYIGNDQLTKNRTALRRMLEAWIVVRRIELIDATAPQLWHVFEHAVVQGISQLGYPSAKIVSSVTDLPHAAQVRVVISDLRLLRDTYPAIASDSLFLPTVVFRLKRFGVTTLIVESENGRLNEIPGHPMSGALRSLVDHQVNTWKVNFFGEQRVAIAVLPSSGTSGASLIRELRFGQSGKLIVDPLFELFENIDEGKPYAVPLEVHLYNETQAFFQYADGERRMFNLVFAPESRNKEEVLRLGQPGEYSAIRDYVHFPIDRKLPFSVVMMVDEYWALEEKNALLNQCDYLLQPLPPEQEEPRFEDPYKLFVRTRGQVQSKRGCRADFFQQDGILSERFYKHRIPLDRVDRVPFLWDFGFLLCNQNQWDRAGKAHISGAPGNHTVSEILAGLTNPAGIPGGLNREPVSWRKFLGACKLVAETEEKRVQQRCSSFDVATTSPDSLTCLLFEIWFSGIWSDRLRFSNYVARNGSRGELKSATAAMTTWIERVDGLIRSLSGPDYPDRKSRRWSLTEMVTPMAPPGRIDFASHDDPELKRFTVAAFGEMPGYSLQLYEAWLLLLEVLDLRSYLTSNSDFELVRDREADTSAAAVRHWYKTACVAARKAGATSGKSGGVPDTLIPARLPGHFSIRGDWFLGVAQGSRSVRLAEQAVDLLSSRRANRARLQAGLGLPVRDIVAGDDVGNIRTGLAVSTAAGSRSLTYAEVTELGGSYFRESERSGANNFLWFFRSGLRSYDRQSIVARRWLQRLFTWTVDYRFENADKWSGGFAAYDELQKGETSLAGSYDSWEGFRDTMRVLRSDLDAAERGTNATGSNAPDGVITGRNGTEDLRSSGAD